VLAVLGACAWWWVTWPERTAREFIETLASRTGGLREMMSEELVIAIEESKPLDGHLVLLLATFQ
jgi:hypothetical protein